MRILLTGKNGQLGWELHRQLERDYEILAIGREDVDFLDLKFLESMLRFMPKLDLIVNAAAYTDVDKAEHEPFTAEAVNSEAAVRLAKRTIREVRKNILIGKPVRLRRVVCSFPDVSQHGVLFLVNNSSCVFFVNPNTSLF